jgi:O-antigen/teichoic acid export membrane protein
VSTDHLQDRVRLGVRWKVVSQAYTQVIRFTMAIILARAVTPHEYGVVAMAGVFVALVLIFSDLALGSALVQREDVRREHVTSVFWLTTGLGVLLTVIAVAASPVVAAFYGEPQVTPVFAVLATTFAITALGATPAALLERRMDFRNLELRQMQAVTVAAAVSLVSVLAGLGLWAVVAQQVALAVVSTLLYWLYARFRPGFRVARWALHDVAGFSARVFGTRIVFYAERNVDNALIGRYIGAAGLGAYAAAYNVMLIPLERIAGPLQGVFYPVVSRMQDDLPRMGRTWLRANRLIGAVTVPTMLCVAIAGQDLVRVVLGPNWAAAGPVVQVLAWVGLHQSLARLNSSVLQAVNRTGDLLRYAVVSVVASVTAFVVGVSFGILGVAVAYAIATTIVAPYYALMVTRAVGLSLRDVLRSLRGVIETGVLVAVAAALVRAAVADAGGGPAARLAVVIATGALLTVPCLAWRARPVFDDAMSMLPVRLRTRLRLPARARAAS